MRGEARRGGAFLAKQVLEIPTGGRGLVGSC